MEKTRLEAFSDGVSSIIILLAFVNVWLANSRFVLVALLWFVPDRRTERVLKKETE